MAPARTTPRPQSTATKTAPKSTRRWASTTVGARLSTSSSRLRKRCEQPREGIRRTRLFLPIGLSYRSDALRIGGERRDAGALDLQRLADRAVAMAPAAVIQREEPPLSIRSRRADVGLGNRALGFFRGRLRPTYHAIVPCP